MQTHPTVFKLLFLLCAIERSALIGFQPGTKERNVLFTKFDLLHQLQIKPFKQDRLKHSDVRQANFHRHVHVNSTLPINFKGQL